jgi:hypothetical protein
MLEDVDNLHTTAGIVALASGAVAVVAVGWCVGLTIAMRRLRAAQRTVLGDSSRDLVAHAAHMQTSFESLAQYVEDFGTRLDRRMDHAELRLDGASRPRLRCSTRIAQAWFCPRSTIVRRHGSTPSRSATVSPSSSSPLRRTRP